MVIFNTPVPTGVTHGDDGIGDDDSDVDGAGIADVSVFPQRYTKVGRQALRSVPVSE